MKRYAVLVALLVALTPVVPSLAADAVFCSDFGIVDAIPVQQVPGSDGRVVNWVPSGTYDHDIIVDRDCYISSGAIVNGKVFEPSASGWSIFVDAVASITGDIEEKGRGSVFFNVGNSEVYTGNITEKGPGQAWIWVDGLFDGNVEENGKGWVRVEVFGDEPSGGPGTFNGNAVEKGRGDAFLMIEAPGAYIGDFVEKGFGGCQAMIELPDEQPQGTIDCSSVEYIDWPEP